ncbi:hypothetical protein Nepgr_032372 [Nepenthes gracilis]|uniref:Uncharacterized protein n=1 Tax=Nepenthes gracilis TaxID=150966 RepID=A0AAD3TJZ2_NEPGR|nr:hypothetical protein Nepgr_032372 [Nepenthes gracilis]
MKYKTSGRTIPTPPAEQDPIRSPQCLDSSVKDSYSVDINIKQQLDPPSENSACFSRPNPSVSPSESSVGPVAPVFLDILATVDNSQNEDLGHVDEHLNPCQPYATCLDQPDNEAKKSTVSNTDVLGHPMNASTLVEVIHEIRSSSAALSGNGVAKLKCCKDDGLDYVSQGVSLDGIRVGWEPDQTLPQKSNDEVSIGPLAPTMVEEDQEDFSNPILVALRMVLEANGTQAYLASLIPEELQTNEDLGHVDEHLNPCQPYATCLDQVTNVVSPELALAAKLKCCKDDGLDYVSQGVSLDGIWVGWEPDQTLPQKSNDEVSIGPLAPTMVEEDQEDFSNPILVALRMVLEANGTQAYLASLIPEPQSIEWF